MLERIGAQHVLVGEHVRAADVLSVTPLESTQLSICWAALGSWTPWRWCAWAAASAWRVLWRVDT